MIKVIKAEDRYTAHHEWLTARFSFSFAEYYDPSNLNFGVHRVLNDDIIAPGTGFGMHPHRDMEIVTYVIEGALEHKDSMGNVGVVRAGEIQTMTAGTGVYHSEYNHSQDEEVHSLQLWFLPDQKGLTPGYAQKQFSKGDQRNALLKVVAPDGADGALPIHSDVTIYFSDLDAGQGVTHRQAAGRKMHLFMIAGELTLNGEQQMKTGDAARITDVEEISVRALESGAEFMLIDLV
ncbi:pirin family protein [Tumebacillus sp. DT12]|uniref:Pirin family protein n=1 Tax=Tumebacillus lacus TaxID=2995335 RepID=A0ABT3WXF9_9BACL|nr:pirin family protein [Tumebacillus lacus]MCX7569358.1 pirin family protein [Tumebacillus lacus]